MGILRIKEILKEKGTTQVELAKKMGISKVALSNSINGNPTLSTLQKVAEILGVDIRDLFYNTTDKPLYIKDENGDLIEVGSLRGEPRQGTSATD